MFRLLFHFVFVYVMTWVIGGGMIWFLLTLGSQQQESNPISPSVETWGRDQSVDHKSDFPHVILKGNRFVPAER